MQSTWHPFCPSLQGGGDRVSEIVFIRGGFARSLEIRGVRIVGRGSSDNIYSNVPYSAQTDLFYVL